MGCNTDLRFQVLVPLPCRGLELCSRRYLLGLAHRKARGARQRERGPFGGASRCNLGEPVQLRRAGATSIVGKDFLPAIALEEPVVGQGHGRFAITGRYSCATDLPDVSKCFRRDSSRHPCQRPPCYFAWGCFRYFGWKRETGLTRTRHEPAIGATKSTRLVGLRRSLARESGLRTRIPPSSARLRRSSRRRRGWRCPSRPSTLRRPADERPASRPW